MKKYKNIFRINEHQIYTEIDDTPIVVSDEDESTKAVFEEIKNEPMGTYEEFVAYEKVKNQPSPQQAEQHNKRIRSLYLDAHRKYQAAVNYGEFEKVTAVDVFIKRLRNKDWAALENVPPQLKYFAGEAGFFESGLIEK